MRQALLLFLGTVLVEFFVAPIGGRVFDYVVPQNAGIRDMIPDLPFYQWGYATVLVAGIVIGAALSRWRPGLLEGNTHSRGAVRRRQKTASEPKLSYSVKPSSGGLWTLQVRNDGAPLTARAFLDLSDLSDWPGAPVGTVAGSWGVNENAKPANKIETGATGVLSFGKFNEQTSAVFYFSDERFGLVLSPYGTADRERRVAITLTCDEAPGWTNQFSVSVTGYGPSVEPASG